MVDKPLKPNLKFGTYAQLDLRVFPHQQFQSVAQTQQELYCRIAEYRVRKLTYLSDRYKAFQGILRSFSQMNGKSQAIYPVENIYGVLLASTRNLTNTKRFQFGLCWTSTGISCRNAMLPSWTWVGWEIVPINSEDPFLRPRATYDHAVNELAVQLGATNPFGMVALSFFRMSITAEFDGGIKMPFEEEFGAIRSRSEQTCPPTQLILSATVFDVKLSLSDDMLLAGDTQPVLNVGPLPEGWLDGNAYFDHPQAGYPGGLTQCIGLLVMFVKPLVLKDAIQVLYLSQKSDSSAPTRE